MRRFKETENTTDSVWACNLQAGMQLDSPKKAAEVSFTGLMAHVKAHMNPKQTVMVQRFKFHTRTQRYGETVAIFVAELTQLTEYCEFGASLDNMLCDHLVFRIVDLGTQRLLLAEPDLDLDKAVAMTRALGMAERDVKYLQRLRAPLTDVHSMSQQPKGLEPCYRCGGKHSPADSRHRTSVCHSCNKRGHFSIMCRTRQVQQQRHGTGTGARGNDPPFKAVVD